MKITFIGIGIFFLCKAFSWAQVQNGKTDFYTKATISLKDYRRVEGHNIVVQNDTIVYSDVNSSEKYKIPKTDVNYLSVDDGTYFGQGALYGGLFMGVMCLSTAMQTTSFNNDAVPIAMGLIGGGTFLGGLIGAMIPKRYTVFINDKYTIKDIETDIFLSDNYIGMRLKFVF